MAELPLVEPDEDLLPVLAQASDEMLDPLVGYILKKGAISSRLETTAAFKVHRPHHDRYWREIASEIQTFGADTIASRFRGGRGVPYAEVVRDVAAKIGVKLPAEVDIAEAEGRILLHVLDRAYEKMSEEERRALLEQLGVQHADGLPAVFPVVALQAAIRIGGFVSYQVAVIVANAVAKVLLGRGLQFAANQALARAIGVLAGPIGWVISAIWTAIDLARPAYRVTIPCVIQVALIRQELLRKENSWTCPRGHQNTKAQKFCGECGAPTP